MKINHHPDDRTLGNIAEPLARQTATASAPCRIDFGGTLDITTFHYPLRRLKPATVNIALDRRTSVTLHPEDGDRIRIAARGLAEAAFAPSTAPYDHPLGLMFAVADYFGASGVRIAIDSTSPPRSGLGGSSVAAVALIAAFSKLLERLGRPPISREATVLLAHAIEQSVAGVPCGIQDQLAAAFGGVHCWQWPAVPESPPFVDRPLLGEARIEALNDHLLVAYLGVTHVSSDVNRTWVKQFIAGEQRERWHAILRLTGDFADALDSGDMNAAADAMNRETALRREMTPGVLESLGETLVDAAQKAGCGARFTGAGGGGCLWAIGEADAIADLRSAWAGLLTRRPGAGLVDCRVDARGVI